MARTPAQVHAALSAQPLDAVKAAHPAEWEAVSRELTAVLDTGDPQALRDYASRIAAGTGFRPATGGSSRPERAMESIQVQRHLAAETIKGISLAAAAGVSKGGRIRFNLFNGWLAQRLLFRSGLERKPVSMPLFRVFWPLVWQRRRLMPLVQPQGIYCFYSARLIRELSALIDGRPCLEIAAGDGTLSRFLNAAGTAVTATDDGSWDAVDVPAEVERLDARKALRRHSPAVVLCSWPPAGNPFERDVFRTPSVELYIVIGARNQFGAGNWDDYRAQTSFEISLDESLSRLVLPPEAEPAVFVFRRATPA